MKHVLCKIVVPHLYTKFNPNGLSASPFRLCYYIALLNGRSIDYLFNLKRRSDNTYLCTLQLNKLLNQRFEIGNKTIVRVYLFLRPVDKYFEENFNDTIPKGNQKMKILQIIQTNLVAMGFTPHKQQNNGWKLSSFQITSITMYCIDICLHSTFLFRVATNVDEYMDVVFQITLEAANLSSLLSFIFKNDYLFNVIERGETEINESEQTR